MRQGHRFREPARVLTADPGWQFGDKLTMSDVKRGAGSNYRTMTLPDILSFQMPHAIADDALLFLWRVGAMQEEALSVMRAWGFAPKSEIVWVKTSRPIDKLPIIAYKGLTTASGVETGVGVEGCGIFFGMGRYVRNCHETCLIGRRGRAKVKDRSVRSVFFAPVGKHSEKPEAFYDIVEKLADGPYVELFARRQRAGWLCFGDEVEGGKSGVTRVLR